MSEKRFAKKIQLIIFKVIDDERETKDTEI